MNINNITDVGKGFFEALGFAENPWLYSLLTASLLPMVISSGATFGNRMCSFLTSLLFGIWNIVIDLVVNFLRVKIVGLKISTLIIETKNPMYEFLNKNIFMKDTTEIEYKKSSVIGKVYNFIKIFKKKDHVEYWKRLRKDRETKIVPILEYGTGGQPYFTHNVYDEHSHIRDATTNNSTNGKSMATGDMAISTNKTFLYNGCQLYFKKNAQNIIKINILTHNKISSNTTENNINALKLVKDFLIDKIQLLDKQYHRCTVNITNAKLRSEFQAMLNGNNISIDDIYKILKTCHIKGDTNTNINIIDSVSNPCGNIFDDKKGNDTSFTVDDDVPAVTSTNDGIVGDGNKNGQYITQANIELSTPIINESIIDYSPFIEMNDAKFYSNGNVYLPKKAEKIFGKKFDYSGSTQYSGSKYLSGDKSNCIIYNQCKMFCINNIHICIASEYVGNSPISSILIMLSRKKQPLPRSEIIRILNILIILTQKTKALNNNNEVVNKTISAYKYESGHWHSYNIDIRTMDTIYLPSELLASILNEFETFMKKRELYDRFQIYYKKGILFYGPPGTGKTTLVRALSNYYNIPLYIININDKTINDDSIVNLLNSLPGSSKFKAVLYEDIDSAFSEKEVMEIEAKMNVINIDPNIGLDDIVQTTDNNVNNNDGDGFNNSPNDSNGLNNSNNNKRKNNKKPVQTQQVEQKFLTYSGLLNALDGVLSNQKGVITIMTTNRLGKLGSALIRPGRIDKVFHLTFCTEEQIKIMVTSMINNYNDFANISVKQSEWLSIEKKIDDFALEVSKVKIKPSRLQFYILENIEDVDKIFKNYEKLMVAEIND